jgi:general secretion pathway protein J
MTRSPKHPHQRGFTLIELLVVMTLLSIIMLGLVTALRGMAQTETKIDQRLKRLDDIRVARAFLAQTLTRVSAQTIDAPGATGQKISTFAATPDSLIWVGIMPARPNLGGRYYFHLAIEDTPDSRELVLRFAPWQPDVMFPDWPNSEARVLISGIKQLSIQAQGQAPLNRNPAEPWPKNWQNGWPVADTLPEQVRLMLTDAQGPWPEWTLPLRPTANSERGYGVATTGPF